MFYLVKQILESAYVSKTKRRQMTLFILAALTIGASEIALSAVQVGLSGAWSKNHLGLQVHETTAGKASISVDFLSYFRVGYSFRQKIEHREGWVDDSEDGEEENLVEFEQQVTQDTHSVDLFAILYAGEIVTPFIFVGIAAKFYEIYFEQEGKETVDEKVNGGLGPNYGAGLAIKLNKQFSIKITNTWSQGYTLKPGEDIEEDKRSANDTLLEVGVSYAIP